MHVIKKKKFCYHRKKQTELCYRHLLFTMGLCMFLINFDKISGENAVFCCCHFSFLIIGYFACSIVDTLYYRLFDIATLGQKEKKMCFWSWSILQTHNTGFQGPSLIYVFCYQLHLQWFLLFQKSKEIKYVVQVSSFLMFVSRFFASATRNIKKILLNSKLFVPLDQKLQGFHFGHVMVFTVWFEI